MSYLKIIIGVFLVSFLMVGSALYKSDQEYGIERDIYNYTENSVQLTLSNISASNPIVQSPGLINQGRLYKVVDAGINFMIISVEQITKMGIEYGYQNPNVNWEKIAKFVMLMLIIWVITMLIKPVGYLLVFLFMIGMWIIEKITKGKKKRTLPWFNAVEEKDGNN